MIEMSEASGQVHLAQMLSLGDILFAQQIRHAPDCVKPIDATPEQNARWNECVAGLNCGKGYYYGCKNKSGDQFASCDRDDCCLFRIHRHG